MANQTIDISSSEDDWNLEAHESLVDDSVTSAHLRRLPSWPHSAATTSAGTKYLLVFFFLQIRLNGLNCAFYSTLLFIFYLHVQLMLLHLTRILFGCLTRIQMYSILLARIMLEQV